MRGDSVAPGLERIRGDLLQTSNNLFRIGSRRLLNGLQKRRLYYVLVNFVYVLWNRYGVYLVLNFIHKVTHVLGQL